MHQHPTLAACTHLKQCIPLIMLLLLSEEVAVQLQVLEDTRFEVGCNAAGLLGCESCFPSLCLHKQLCGARVES